MSVNASCRVNIIDDPNEIRKARSPKDKPFIRLTMEDGTLVEMSLNLAEMIGGAARGARLRFESEGWPSQSRF